MQDIYRIFECQDGKLTELVFIQSKASALEYLNSCNTHNTDENTFYFAHLLKVET